MAAFKQIGFLGEQPRLHPRLLSESKAQIAKNLKIERGVLQPIKNSPYVRDVYPQNLNDEVKELFLYTTGDWFEFQFQAWASYASEVGDPYNRVIFNNPNKDPQCRVTYNSIIGDGTSTRPAADYELGMPVPGTPLAVKNDPASATITGITQAAPAVVTTSTAHNFRDGWTIGISGVVGMTEVNDNEYEIEIIDSTSFRLVDTDSQGYGVYSSGGTAAYVEAGVYESRYYVYTYVNIFGEESAPGDPSPEVEIYDGQNVTITFDSLPSGSHVPLQSRRLYRTNVAEANAQYQYVTTVALTQNAKTITNVTQANPAKVTTSAAHGYTTGDEVKITGVAGMTELNNRTFFLTVVDSTHFYLDGEDSTNHTAYTSGGTAAIVSGTTYTDYRSSALLGEVLPTTTYDPPNDELTGFVRHPNGFHVGFFGTTICFSEPGYVHAWPIEYRLSTEFDVVGMGIFGNTVVITTTGDPYLCLGTDPSAMSLVRMEIHQSCVSARGIVDAGEAVVYPSPDGVISVSGDGPTNLTSQLFTRDQWQALNPSSIHACYWEGYYFAFYDTGTATGSFAIAIGAPDDGVVFYDQHAETAFTDLASDIVYFIYEDSMFQWDQGTSVVNYRWKSRPLYADKPINLACGQVRADAYPMQIRLYGDGELLYTKRVLSSTPFRLPAKTRSSKFEVEFLGRNTVFEFALATSMLELSGT